MSGGVDNFDPSRLVTVTYAASTTIDVRQGSVFFISATGDCTLSTTGTSVGMNGMIIEVVFHAVSSNRTLTLTTGSSSQFAFNDDITALSATTASKHDKLFFQYLTITNRFNIFAYSKGNST